MKYIIACLLSAAIVLTLCTNVSALEASEGGDGIMDAAIAQVIASQLSEDEKELFKSSDTLNLSGDPILRVYNQMFWSLADKPLKEIIAGAEVYSKAYNTADYYVLSDNPYKIRIFNNQVTKLDSTDIPQYVKDISALSNYVTVNGTRSYVKGIYCFDAETSHQGIVVYVQTDTDSLVKYYENRYSAPLLFAEDEFRVYATDYYAYITSYENNYNDKGEPVGGAVLSFKEFIDNHLGNTTNNGLSVLQGNRDYLWIGSSVLIGIGAIAIGLCLIKRGKKAANIQTHADRGGE